MPWGTAVFNVLAGVAAISAILMGAALYVRKSRNRPFYAVARDTSADVANDTTKLLTDLPILVVDLETTGLDVRRDRVVSVGAIAAQGGSLHRNDVLDILVNPDQPIPARSTAIHGITDDMVAVAPLFTEAFGNLDAMLIDRVVVGHNIGFDLAILRGECTRLGLQWLRPVSLDLVRIAAALDPRERDLTLEGMAGRWGVPVSGRHTALGDAMMTAEMWTYVLPLLNTAGVITLGDALAFERRARTVIANQKQAGW